MLIAILVLVMAQLLPQPTTVPTLLVTTLDGLHQSTSTVWNVDPLTGSVNPIYTLPAENGMLDYDSFPSYEILKMEEGISAEAFPAEWPTTYPVLQHIIGAWQFGYQHLLIQTANELCDRRSSYLCYGYYEFSVLNPVDTSDMESLIKIPYHNRMLEQWPECTAGIFNTVYVDQVAVNPVFEQIALTIRATNDCRSPIQRSTIILLDFSGATIVEISDAGRLVWSPLGDQLAYYRQERCEALLCPAALYVYSTASHETVTVASSDMIEINFRPSVAWIDNQRLLYSWMVQINAVDSEISLNEYDLTDGTSTDVDRQLIVSNFYRLDYSYFIGATSNQRVAFTLDDHTITVQAELGSADAIHYDSHSSVLLLEQQDGDILIVRSDADPLVVDVWGLLLENEYIVYLSPADSRG